MRIFSGLALGSACLAWLLAGRYLLRRGWAVLPLLAACVALLFAGNEWRWQRFESELATAVAPVLQGRDSGFACERPLRGFFSSQGHVGHVWFDADGTPARDAFLSSSTCSAIKRWRHDPATASLRELVAVHTLAHEAAHLTGERSEAVAECRAIAADPAVLQRLGASEQVALALTARYLREVYPRLPDDYRGGCPAADRPAR